MRTLACCAGAVALLAVVVPGTARAAEDKESPKQGIQNLRCGCVTPGTQGSTSTRLEEVDDFSAGGCQLLGPGAESASFLRMSWPCYRERKQRVCDSGLERVAPCPSARPRT
jgi:hypothetical protein